MPKYDSTKEPYKWYLNPTASLRELGRMDNEAGYRKTICGIHRIIWSLININANGMLDEDIRTEINDLLEIAYTMGKRMDYRLQRYYAVEHGHEEALVQAMRGKFVDVVYDYTPLGPPKGKKKGKK